MRQTHPELQIEEDMRQQQREWVFERVGWGLMFLLVVAALLGLTGRGGMGFNQQTAGSNERGLEVTYERYLRIETPSEMRITFHRPRTGHQLRLSKEFLEKVRLEQIVPQPRAEKADHQGVTYTFDSQSAGAEVFLYLLPKRSGRIRTVLSDGTSSFTLSQLVYP